MKILLVDDDTDLLDVTAYALRREGFNVIVATDGTQALRRWQSDEPDLILLDVGMPRMSGFEVCRKIRENPALRDVKIVMLTAKGRDVEKDRGLNLGANAYVTKPFSTKELMNTVRGLLPGDE